MSSRQKLLLAPGKRKTARATAAITPGTGKVRVNGFPAEMVEPEAARELILSPMILAGDLRDKVDIDVTVKGGGVMGRAFATAMAISRALVEYFRSDELRKKIMAYDPHLIKGDPRRTEPKKPGGKGARRKRQKSYR